MEHIEKVYVMRRHRNRNKVVLKRVDHQTAVDYIRSQSDEERKKLFISPIDNDEVSQYFIH